MSVGPKPEATRANRSLAELAWVFFWVSTVTPGGGMAMLPLLEREFVEKRRWLTAQEMVDVVAVMQSLPGLIIVNMAVLIGYRVRGVTGALVSAFASVVSPFVLIAAVAAGLAAFSDSPALNHAFLGVRAATAALILLSLGKLAKATLTTPLARTLGVGGFLAAVVLRVDVTWVIFVGFAVGVGLIVRKTVGKAGK